MRREIVIIFVFLPLSLIALGQQKKNQEVFTSDIDNYWKAYDSCEKTSDSLQQLHYIQTLYIDKGT
ncbi:MAG TPA: hypothetical protein VNS32_08830, partial [Flavisolibacter sp.]|nr:hypothetical protein [Flavisolibacter sp.]